LASGRPDGGPSAGAFELSHHQTMAIRAEISSLSTTLEELTRRVSSLADSAQSEDEETAMELFGVERSLSGALRRLRKLGEERRP
jgi:hypothetical protein